MPMAPRANHLTAPSNPRRGNSRFSSRPAGWPIAKPHFSYGRSRLPMTRLTRLAAAVLGGNALPIQKIDLVEGPTRLIEEQHQPQPIGQIGFAGEIYSWIGHGRDAHATYEAKA